MELLKPSGLVSQSVRLSVRMSVRPSVRMSVPPHSVGVNTFPFISFSPCISFFFIFFIFFHPFSFFQILLNLSCYMELLNLSGFIFYKIGK